MKNPFALANGSLRRSVFGVNSEGVARILHAPEWQGRNVVKLARSLLGKVLVRTTRAGRDERVILETEAYVGRSDLACHASKGRTPRTEVMFGPGGRWYVYLCYGIHDMLNLVVGPDGFPAAILIRGVEGASGPGRVTKALAIDGTINTFPSSVATGLHLEDHGIVVPRGHIASGPRVGVGFAGPVWAAKPWRFQISVEKLQRTVRA